MSSPKDLTELPIRGLTVVADFVIPAEGKELIDRIDAGQWSTELKRRVQHYGYRYLYALRRAGLSPAPPLPLWATQIISKLHERQIVSQSLDQLIINEYSPGQGIAPHIDNTLCFDREIVSLSLGSSCVMAFSRNAERFELLLRAGDLLVLRDHARYLWRHEIAPRKNDRWEGQIVARTRRLSLTFRKALQ